MREWGERRPVGSSLAPREFKSNSTLACIYCSAIIPSFSRGITRVHAPPRSWRKTSEWTTSATRRATPGDGFCWHSETTDGLIIASINQHGRSTSRPFIWPSLCAPFIAAEKAKPHHNTSNTHKKPNPYTSLLSIGAAAHEDKGDTDNAPWLQVYLISSE